MKIRQRQYDPALADNLAASGVPPILARLYAARNIAEPSQLEHGLSRLIPPEALTHNSQMAKLLADAIAAGQSILVIGDYDADGATATAVAVKGLRNMGAKVDFLVPNRFEYGYGLTPEIVQLAAQQQPEIIITVDNGIASVDGVREANKLGIRVLITDHHLPGETTPEAACIINPNQHGCNFPSKHLAGVGVAFYMLLALRSELRNRGFFAEKTEPNLAELLDLVALGTVADLVKLDHNNRILVEQGLRRIRAGQCCPAITCLLQIAGRNPATANAQDLGFSVGPRLNAAGRLEDMSLGIACLLAENATTAMPMAQQLHELNLQRREIETDMQFDAMNMLVADAIAQQYSISVYHPEWHQGVIGILASRIKEKFHRPVIAFASADNGLLKGSGRSIAGLHLRDALDVVTKQHPQLIIKFGGHAMAAGLTIREQDFALFNQSFEQVVRAYLPADALEETIEIDGALEETDMHWETAQTLANVVWGQGFPPPLFHDTFQVLEQRIVGEKHLKLTLKKQRLIFDAIYFNCQETVGAQISAVYQLQPNAYNGMQKVQLNIHTIV